MKKAKTVLFDIVSDIETGHMVTGDRLPSLAEMLCRYGASKSTVREALGLLEMGGLVQIRPGSGNGARVGDVRPHNLAMVLLPFLSLSNASYDHLLTSWTVSEPLLAEAAARNPDRERVRVAMAPYLDPEPGCGCAVGRAVDFHDAVADLADNPVLLLVVRTLSYLVLDLYRSLTQTAPGADQVRQDHLAVAQAIVAGEPQRARAAMDAHLALMAEHVRRHIPREPSRTPEWARRLCQDQARRR